MADQPKDNDAAVWGWIIAVILAVVVIGGLNHGSGDQPSGDPDCYASAPAKYTGDC